MNIKNDYSFLFNSLGNSNSRSGASGNIFNAIDLSEYSSIKRGTYGKLLKAYYAKEDTESTTSTDNKDTDVKKKSLKQETQIEKLNDVANDASSVKDSAKKLTTRGTDSLFKEKELTTKDAEGNEVKTMGYDMDAIYKSVKDFTDKYNSFVKTVGNSDSSKVDREFDELAVIVTDYSQSLKNAGITNNKDNTLTVDENTLKATDVSELKKLFNGNASFAYKVSAKTSMIGATAESEAKIMKNYTSTGNYDKSFASGNLMDSII